MYTHTSSLWFRLRDLHFCGCMCVGFAHFWSRPVWLPWILCSFCWMLWVSLPVLVQSRVYRQLLLKCNKYSGDLCDNFFTVTWDRSPLKPLTIYYFKINGIIELKVLLELVLLQGTLWIFQHICYFGPINSLTLHYRLLLGLSHWDPYAVHRGGCLELYYCNMVEWSWWDSSLIWTIN